MAAEDCALDLNRQLDAYAAVAKTHEPRNRWSRWPVYAAAAGAALAGASAASADIIYSGPLNLTGPSIDIAMNGRHGVSFTVDFDVRRHLVSSTTYQGGHSPSANLLHEFGLAGGYNASIFRDPAFSILFAKNFATGSPISGTDLAPEPFLGTAFSVLTHQGQLVSTGGAGPRNNFPNGGFLGFEMFATNGQGGAVAGPVELGWIHVQFDSTFPGSYEITGWAYNTDGPIDAGEISAIPEPGTMALMLLAAGAAGVLAWKRRGIPQAPNA